MDDLLTQMGKRIYSRRKQLRLNQEQLAERANLTPQTISSAELGQKALRPENIIKICSALDISTDYLLLGKINAVDSPLLMNRISKLSPAQYHYLEDIINSYILAVLGKETSITSFQSVSLFFSTVSKSKQCILNYGNHFLIHLSFLI